MPVFRDAVSDTTTTTGTGTLTLAGVTAEAGTRTISSAHSNADVLYYRVENSSKTEWEVGLGTYTSSGTTLSRDTILASSNSGSAVNFSAGTKNVYTVISASWAQGSRGTITANDPFEYLQTWNNAGVTFTALRVNVTNTASNAASLLLDLQVGGSSLFRVDRAGALTINGGALSYTPGSTSFQVACINATGSPGFTWYNSSTVGFQVSSGIQLGSAATFSFTSGNANGTSDVILARDAANTLAQRNTTNAQTKRLYFSYTDASNYTRLAFKTASGLHTIETESAGTGEANIDLALTPKGTGRVRYGTHSAIAAETVTGYITIKDSGGTERKLAVVS